MGGVCCVGSRNRSDKPNSEASQRNVRRSPSWSFSWENRGRVNGEVDNQISPFSYGSSRNVDVENKYERGMEIGYVSDIGGPLKDFRTSTQLKFSINEGTAPASGPSVVKNDLSAMMTAIRKSSAVANPSTSRLSISEPDPLSSQNQPQAIESGSSAHANSSPAHHRMRRISIRQLPGLESWNDSVSEVRQTCGLCSKYLTERSSWSNQIILAVVAVLVCGHVFHTSCLEHTTAEIDKYDPVCPLCTGGEKHVSKTLGKASRVKAHLKGKSIKTSRNRVIDSSLDNDTSSSDDSKSTRRPRKVLKSGPSSSMSSSGKPFWRRFSLGSTTVRK